MTARLFTWDYKEQPGLAAIAAAVTELSANGPVFMREFETGGDDYAWIVSDTPLTDEQADRLYSGEEDRPMADVIRIKTGVSMRSIANSTQEDVIEVERAKWDAMSADEREQYLDEIAQTVLSNEVEAWAYVDEEG
jgi:hypothetical protein